MAAELDQARLGRVQVECEPFEPRAHVVEKAQRVSLVLEADKDVVGVAHNDHVALGLPPSPAVGPEVEPVVQVDVGQKRRYRRALPRPSVAIDFDALLDHSRLQPFLDQAEHAIVADAMLYETHEPFMVHAVEELLDVGVQNEVHPAVLDSRA